MKLRTLLAIWLAVFAALSAQAQRPDGNRARPQEGSLKVGDPAPDFTLAAVDGKITVQLSSHKGVRPVVLVFGSYTCPPFRSQADAIERVYNDFKDRAAFFLVYIREAHPSDGWQVPANERQGVVFTDPKTLEERSGIAKTACAKLNLSLPALVDSIDDAVNKAYSAWPDRLYVVGADGKIAYKSGPGPRGFRADELRQFLEKNLPSH